MALNPIFKITLVKGQIVRDDRVAYERFLQDLIDGEYEEIIRKKRKPRSNAQNRYFHGVIVKMVSDEIGISMSEAKEMLKLMFLAYEIKGILTLRSTAGLSTAEQEDFNEQCRRWAAEELQLDVPLPNEVDYSNYDTNG